MFVYYSISQLQDQDPSRSKAKSEGSRDNKIKENRHFCYLKVYLCVSVWVDFYHYSIIENYIAEWYIHIAIFDHIYQGDREAHFALLASAHVICYLLCLPALEASVVVWHVCSRF